MMIDLKRKLVYAHIPRTGGTSISSFMHSLGATRKYGNHCSIASLPEELKDFTTFCTMRDPVEWYASQYNKRNDESWLRRGEGEPEGGVEFGDFLTRMAVNWSTSMPLERWHSISPELLQFLEELGDANFGFMTATFIYTVFSDWESVLRKLASGVPPDWGKADIPIKNVMLIGDDLSSVSAFLAPYFTPDELENLSKSRLNASAFDRAHVDYYDKDGLSTVYDKDRLLYGLFGFGKIELTGG